MRGPRLTRREKAFLATALLAIAFAAFEHLAYTDAANEAENLVICGRQLITALREHPEMIAAIANETDGFAFYGCIHWAEDFANRLAAQYNVSASWAFDLIWITGYFAGRTADHPTYVSEGALARLGGVLALFILFASTIGASALIVMLCLCDRRGGGSQP